MFLDVHPNSISRLKLQVPLNKMLPEESSKVADMARAESGRTAGFRMGVIER